LAHFAVVENQKKEQCHYGKKILICKAVSMLFSLIIMMAGQTIRMTTNVLGYKKKLKEKQALLTLIVFTMGLQVTNQWVFLDSISSLSCHYQSRKSMASFI